MQFWCHIHSRITGKMKAFFQSLPKYESPSPQYVLQCSFGFRGSSLYFLEGLIPMLSNILYFANYSYGFPLNRSSPQPGVNWDKLQMKKVQYLHRTIMNGLRSYVTEREKLDSYLRGSGVFTFSSTLVLPSVGRVWHSSAWGSDSVLFLGDHSYLSSLLGSPHQPLVHAMQLGHWQDLSKMFGASAMPRLSYTL